MELLAERSALEELRDDVWLPLVHPDVINGENVGMVEGASRPRLLLEPPHRILVVRASNEKLDRDPALELGVARDVDAAHSSPAELAFREVSSIENERSSRRRSGDVTRAFYS